MPEKRFYQTQVNTDYVVAVLHSTVEGDEEDPRVRAANYNNALLEQTHGLPDGTVWCADAVHEIKKLRREV